MPVFASVLYNSVALNFTKLKFPIPKKSVMLSSVKIGQEFLEKKAKSVQTTDGSE